MPEIRVTPTNTEHRRIQKTEWRSLHSKADALGNTIHFRIDLNGPEPFGYAWRENAQGVRFGDSLRIVVPATRPDDGTMWIAGTSAWFKMSTHDSEQEGVRDHDEWRYEWVNVYAPWPGQPQGAGEPEGAAHAMAPEVGGGGGGEIEVDYERIERYIDAKTTLIVNNMVPKMEAAINNKRVLTEANGRDYFYQFFKDRLYEVFVQNVPGFWEWLREKVGGGEGPVEPTEPTEGGTPNG